MSTLGWCTRSDFRRQLAAAGRLGPAEAWRARTAILLSCGDPAVESHARRTLRATWGVDDVVSVVTPVRAIAASDPQTTPWLRAWLAREIRDLSPELVAVAAHAACAHIHDAGGYFVVRHQRILRPVGPHVETRCVSHHRAMHGELGPFDGCRLRGVAIGRSDFVVVERCCIQRQHRRDLRHVVP